MAPDKKGDTSNRIPISFLDSENETTGANSEEPHMSNEFPEELTDDIPSESDPDSASDEEFDGQGSIEPSPQADGSPADVSPSAGGPEVAELVATGPS